MLDRLMLDEVVSAGLPTPCVRLPPADPVGEVTRCGKSQRADGRQDRIPLGR